MTLPPTELPVADPHARRFSYAPGEHRYLLTTDAAVAVGVDSMPPLSSQIRTRILYTLTIATGTTGEPRISGSIDSLTVDRGPRVPPQDLPPFPLRWGPQPATDHDTGCSVAQELIAAGRELLPQLPTNLRDGYRWQDTTTLRLCRAGIPVTISAVHDYQVVGPTTFQGDSTLQISRATAATLSATHSIDQHPIELSGATKSTAQLYVDLEHGTLTARTEQARTDLTIRTPRATTHLTQDLRGQLTRQRPK